MTGWYRVSYDPQLKERFRAAIWAMFVESYASIGLMFKKPSELDEYDLWDVYVPRGVPLAFRLARATTWGEKLGLAGSDGSREGRGVVKNCVIDSLMEEGNYAEVSHRLEELATQAGVRAVCGVYAQQVIPKTLEIEPDGLHYRRRIANVGEVVKILVGRPINVPTTPIQRPRCRMSAGAVLGVARRSDLDRSRSAAVEHAMSIVGI